MYLVIGKAVTEEEKVTFKDHILSFLSKIGAKISKKDKPIYNECIKMIKFVRSFKSEKDINTDVLNGFDVVLENKEATDLDILLEQLEESRIFRTNRDAFMRAYGDSVYGVFSTEERMYMRAYERAYDREKELCKKINNCSHS